ncbi:MAG: hypothetical protein QGF59_30095, partial [Pirellulaceae bacterium]|nr:hypothetical protein [Pirellulaceae bacterium]
MVHPLANPNTDANLTAEGVDVEYSYKRYENWRIWARSAAILQLTEGQPATFNSHSSLQKSRFPLSATH